MRQGILNYCARIARRALGARCLLCNAVCDAGPICAGCGADLPRLPAPTCRVCAIPITAGEICGTCLADPPHFDQTACSVPYAYPVDRVIQRFKYGGDLALAPLLADLMAASVRAAPRPDLIVPMPLSRERLAERGFNQSIEIAQILGRALGVLVVPHACERIGHGPAQAVLPWDERAKNVRGAFICRVDVAGQSVAVVDDVLTTGATLSEVARVLKKAGARQVTGWVAARTLRPK